MALRQSFLFFAARRVEQVELFAAVREGRERDAEEPYFSGAVAVAFEQFLHGFKHDGIEMRGLAQRVGARDGFKSRVADRDRDYVEALSPASRSRFIAFWR